MAAAAQKGLVVRQGPSPALVKARQALEVLQSKYADFRKTKNTELAEARSITTTDAMLFSAASATGAAVTGAARGAATRFDIDRKYIDGATFVSGLITAAVSAYFDFNAGMAAGNGMMAPITADMVEALVAGDGEDELDQ